MGNSWENSTAGERLNILYHFSIWICEYFDIWLILQLSCKVNAIEFHWLCGYEFDFLYNFCFCAEWKAATVAAAIETGAKCDLWMQMLSVMALRVEA